MMFFLILYIINMHDNENFTKYFAHQILCKQKKKNIVLLSEI